MPEIPEIRSLDLDRRRLAVISVHATGFDPGSDRIVEVGVVMRKAFAADRTYHRLVDPGIPTSCRWPRRSMALPMPTSPGASTSRTSRRVRLASSSAADLAGFGIRRLAVPLLEVEFRRVGLFFNWSRRSIVDLRDIYLHHEPRHLRAAVGHYLGRERPVAAGALAEAEASSRVLDAQFERHGDLPTTVPGL